MDHHGNTADDLTVSTHPITQLLYSCKKFYPEAPDNSKCCLFPEDFDHCSPLDAAKFVNDDYVLACSLENGQVLFLHGYHDQSPVVVETHLQSNCWVNSNEKQCVRPRHQNGLVIVGRNSRDCRSSTSQWFALRQSNSILHSPWRFLVSPSNSAHGSFSALWKGMWLISVLPTWRSTEIGSLNLSSLTSGDRLWVLPRTRDQSQLYSSEEEIAWKDSFPRESFERWMSN